MQDEQGCFALLEQGRADGVHAVMTRLLGECTCQQEARVIELYTVEGARTAQLLTA
jgi:hypothetical protein